jgi:hypothetical protein
MDMVERVARAIATAQLRRQYVGKLENIGCVIEIDKVWPEFVPEAIAAIEAMREPTDEMLDAADKVQHECLQWSLEPGEGLDGMYWAPAWRAMIDSILKSTRETAPAQPVEEK